MTKKQRINLSIKVLVSVGLVSLLLLKVNVWDILVSLRRITPTAMALYAVVLLLGMGISSYKWRLLVRFKGFDATLAQCFRFYITGSFINNFFPSFIGGDAYRAYQVARHDRRFAAAATTVVMDRITGLLGAMALSVFFALVNIAEVVRHPVLLMIVAVIASGLLFVLCLDFLMRMRLWKFFARFVPAPARNVLRSDSGRKAVEFLRALHEYSVHRVLFAKAFGMSVLFGLVGLALLNFILIVSLGIRIGILDYLSVIFLISIISSIPISVGVPEWAYVMSFGFFGVSAPSIVAVAIMIRILQMVVTLTALPMYLASRSDSGIDKN